MENDLIRRSDALKLFEDEERYGYIDEQDVRSIPSVDAVPVVRCKDCKHKDVIPDMYGIGTEALYCPAIEHYVEHDFFCKYGRTGDET